MKRLIKWCLLTFVSLLGMSVQAAVTCNVSPSGYSSVYDSLATANNVNQGSVTVNCMRAAGDPATFNYILFTDDGVYNNGANNRAKLTTANTYLLYDFFTTSAYSTNWSKSNKCVTGTISFGSGLSGVQTLPFYSRIPAQQATPQGLFLDTVVVYLSSNRTTCTNNATQDFSGSMQVSISTVPACQVATPPTDMVFDYTSWQGSPAPANSSYGIRCSINLGYTMGLLPDTGTASGLAYTLRLNNLGGTGNGAVQTYTITGDMPANQVGSCTLTAGSTTCSETNQHTLQVNY